MRIIAGQYRGRKLTPLGKGDPKAHLRPTPDRVRESLFNRLTHLGVLEDALVLDLFAGTGALGLEALSRGAAFAHFVENSPRACALIERNIALLDLASKTKLIRQDAQKLPPNPDRPASLVFLDPPYGQNRGAGALIAARKAGWIAKDAHIFWEEQTPQSPPPGFSRHDDYRYGNSTITVLKPS